MIYIQRRDKNGVETVDEFATQREARKMVLEYQISDPAGRYYTSRRACKNWRDTLENK